MALASRDSPSDPGLAGQSSEGWLPPKHGRAVAAATIVVVALLLQLLEAKPDHVPLCPTSFGLRIHGDGGRLFSHAGYSNSVARRSSSEDARLAAALADRHSDRAGGIDRDVS